MASLSSSSSALGFFLSLWTPILRQRCHFSLCAPQRTNETPLSALPLCEALRTAPQNGGERREKNGDWIGCRSVGLGLRDRAWVVWAGEKQEEKVLKSGWRIDRRPLSLLAPKRKEKGGDNDGGGCLIIKSAPSFRTRPHEIPARKSSRQTNVAYRCLGYYPS